MVLAGLRPLRLPEPGDRLGQPKLASRTVVDRCVLDRELRRIRAEGAAVEVDEWARGVAGIAVPVTGPGPGSPRHRPMSSPRTPPTPEGAPAAELSA